MEGMYVALKTALEDWVNKNYRPDAGRFKRLLQRRLRARRDAAFEVGRVIGMFFGEENNG